MSARKYYMNKLCTITIRFTTMIFIRQSNVYDASVNFNYVTCKNLFIILFNLLILHVTNAIQNIIIFYQHLPILMWNQFIRTKKRLQLKTTNLTKKNKMHFRDLCNAHNIWYLRDTVVRESQWWIGSTVERKYNKAGAKGRPVGSW